MCFSRTNRRMIKYALVNNASVSVCVCVVDSSEFKSNRLQFPVLAKIDELSYLKFYCIFFLLFIYYFTLYPSILFISFINVFFSNFLMKWKKKTLTGLIFFGKKSQSLKINLRKRNVERFLAKEKKNNVSICFVESLNRFWTRQQETVKCFFLL